MVDCASGIKFLRSHTLATHKDKELVASVPPLVVREAGALDNFLWIVHCSPLQISSFNSCCEPRADLKSVATRSRLTNQQLLLKELINFVCHESLWRQDYKWNVLGARLSTHKILSLSLFSLINLFFLTVSPPNVLLIFVLLGGTVRTEIYKKKEWERDSDSDRVQVVARKRGSGERLTTGGVTVLTLLCCY